MSNPLLNPSQPSAEIESLAPHTGVTLSQAITVVDSDDGNSDTDSSRGDSASAGDHDEDEDDVDIVTQLVAAPTPSPAPDTNDSNPAAPTPTVPVPAVTAAPPNPATQPVQPAFTSGVAYYNVPATELEPEAHSVTSTRWYVVTRGRFVGVFPHAFMANDAVMHVPNAVRERRNNLLTALDVFNAALRHGHVSVVP
ncbi:hypothetical protein BDZ89DRAFT_1145021 [Hymenopellis radicata]|nr:hypothetical protein BDZ89DRAFT_1146739 [Hymenopellis radicata]KAF9005810.1 hypothetical protein BDZ89DRAFT_1145021 [Hymenopellis radicata]